MVDRRGVEPLSCPSLDLFHTAINYSVYLCLQTVNQSGRCLGLPSQKVHFDICGAKILLHCLLALDHVKSLAAEDIDIGMTIVWYKVAGYTGGFNELHQTVASFVGIKLGKILHSGLAERSHLNAIH